MYSIHYFGYSHVRVSPKGVGRDRAVATMTTLSGGCFASKTSNNTFPHHNSVFLRLRPPTDRAVARPTGPGRSTDRIRSVHRPHPVGPPTARSVHRPPPTRPRITSPDCSWYPWYRPGHEWSP